MIKINNYKLTPAITATWGDITGDVRNQEDLVEYIKENGTAAWGNISGDISDQKDLMNTLEGYAKEQWVKDQGYLTSTSLTGYATESWVNDQGYLTEHQPLKTINNNSLVGEGNIEIGGLTPEQEEAITPLLDKSEGVLYTDVIESNEFNYKNWAHTLQPIYLQPILDGIVYFDPFNYNLYKFNPKTMNFEYLCHPLEGSGQKFWMDKSGRMFQGNVYEIDVTTGAATAINLYYDYSGYRNKLNLFYGDIGIWAVSENVNNLMLYDEQLKQFTGTYKITLPQDYNENIIIDICNVFTYKGHKLFHTNNNKTYEVVDTNAGLTVTDVTGTYFPTLTFSFDPYFIFSTENGNLWYINGYNIYVYTGTGTWETPDIHLENSFDYEYVVYGNYVLGGVYITDKYSILNLGQTEKVDSWTPVNNIAVDLESDQNIKGIKEFGVIKVQDLDICRISTSPYNVSFIDLGKNKTNAQKMEFIVPGMFTLNGVNIATTDNCFVNKALATSGPLYKSICETDIVQYQYYFKTPSGRLICDDGNFAYEFDGSQFTRLHTVTIHPRSRNFATITDGLFAKDNRDNLIKWNDTSSNWEVVILLKYPHLNIWAADANTLRLGYSDKLDNTGGTYSWVEDITVNPPSNEIDNSYIIGQNVYVINNQTIYQYEESNKTFTEIGHTTDWPNDNHFMVFENNLYYFTDIVRKIDFSQQPGTNKWDVETNIIFTNWDCLYIEYNNKLYLTNNNENTFGYCYGIEETTPEVPATDGTYVLKAVRSGEQVTFSWVTES